MVRWRWMERGFRFDFPVAKFPDLLERWRGTPARVEDRLRGVPEPAMSRNDGGWSIKQNLGHLIDLDALPVRRLEQILNGEQTLVAADMSNEKTHLADHNARPIATLMHEFRARRMEGVARFEAVDERDWGRSGIHPRLKAPMRIVDILCFDSEHDDYHLARIGELVRKFGGGMDA